jgi:hypothetical protein
MVKKNLLQFEFINSAWLDILQCAAQGQNDAMLFWKFLAQYSSALNTEMYGPWGGVFRQTVVNNQARAAYINLFNIVGPDLTLGILRELLALCNSGGGIQFYRTFFRPLIQQIYPPNTIVEMKGDPDVIGQIDVTNGQLIIN